MRKRAIRREERLQGRTSDALIVLGLFRQAEGPVFAKKGTIPKSEERFVGDPFPPKGQRWEPPW